MDSNTMATSSYRKTGSNPRGSLSRKNSVEADLWCLTCAANLRTEGVSYVALSRHKTSELCDTFARVLGAEFSESYASVNVCNRCERQLRRLGRYNSIILARNEGRKLRDQLEKNLAKYGQSVEISGDDLSISPPKPISSSTKESLVPVKRANSADFNAKKKLGDFANKPSSVGFDKFYTAAEKSVEHNGGRGNGGIRRSLGHIPILDFKKKSLIPHYIEEEKRWESRRRQWSKSPSTSEESGKQSENEPVDRKITENKALPNQSRGVSFRDDQPRKQQAMEGDTVAGAMDTSDKAALVQPSDSFDQSDAKKKAKLKFGFRSPGDSKKSPLKSPSSEIGDTNGDQGRDKEHWTERINPFDADAERDKAAGSFESALSFDDDVFVKDIIDLDGGPRQHEENGSTGRNSVQTIDSEQIRSDLMADLDLKNFRDFSRASSTSVDTSEVDPNDENADNRSSLSETEERINIKTQFKGAYYNIGSTEDLLQEFENELAADRARFSKLTPVASIDKEEAAVQEKKLAEPTPEPTKGKLTKYESLDLDIDKTNPFFNDVFSEYKRRVNAKRGAMVCKNASSRREVTKSNRFGRNSSAKSKVLTRKIYETVPEVDSRAEYRKQHPDVQICKTNAVVNDVIIEKSIPIKETEAAVLGGYDPAGKQDQDNAPLIDFREEDKENDDSKPDLTDLEEPFFEDSKNLEDDSLMSEEAPREEPEETQTLKHAEEELPEGKADDNTENILELSEVVPVENGVIEKLPTESSLDEKITPEQDKETTVANADKEEYLSVATEGQPITKKSEKSPLISADLKVKGGRDKFKDQEPGLLCCTIL